MPYICKEEWMKAKENIEPLTPEEKEKLEELREKIKKLSPQKMRELRRQMDYQDGFCK